MSDDARKELTPEDDARGARAEESFGVDPGRRTSSVAPARPKDEELPGSGEGVPVTTEEQGRQASLWADAWRQLRRNPLFIVPAIIIAIFVLMAIWPGLFTSFYPGNPNPRDCSLSNSLIRPNATNWFGYDLQGCDYYARTVYGARVSISIGILATAFAVLIAITWGSIAGYYGGAIDAVIARLTDVAFAIPVILGGIVAITVLRNTGSSDANVIIGSLTTLFRWMDDFLGERGFGVVSFILIVLGWPTMLRLMRSSVLSAKEADYVDAARALGATDARIIIRHILPNALAPVIVYATITVGVIISAEAALSFLGVGLQLPAISWGLMINVAQNRILSAPHLLFFPGIFLVFAVFGFITMGDALRDALDPKLR
jgi:oligopeptide transport system permease protein